MYACTRGIIHSLFEIFPSIDTTRVPSFGGIQFSLGGFHGLREGFGALFRLELAVLIFVLPRNGRTVKKTNRSFVFQCIFRPPITQRTQTHTSSTMAASTLLACAALAAPQMNLLFMMADQLRWDAIGSGGATTPNIDSIGANGLTLAKAYTTTPTCTPARAALLTGQKPWNHGMLGYGAIASKYPVEMADTLDTAGYQTYSFGKDHFGWNSTAKGAIPHGYEHLDLFDGLVGEMDNYTVWFENLMPGKTPRSGWPTLDYNSWRGAPYVYNESLHPTAYVGRQAADGLKQIYAKQRSGEDTRPFFVKISFHRPHSPYDPPQRILDKVTEADLKPLRIATDNWDAWFANTSHGCGPSKPDAWCGLMPTNETILAKRAYYGSIRFVDEWVGTILEEVNYDNTLILWTADHGDGQGDHYHWRKGYPYEVSAHIPMLIRWPASVASQIPRGSVSYEVTELRDVFPTMADAAGLEIPATVDGASLLCLVDPTRKQCSQWREYLDLEHSTCYNAQNHWNALTDGKVKYIFNANYAANSTVFPQEQLFNLTADPYELVDLHASAAYASELSMWRERMVKQFENEGRGDVWVKAGVLQQRTAGQTYSPNYPK